MRAAAPAATPRCRALELYAEAFDAAGALDRLDAFASFNGPAFYGLPRNPARSRCARAWTLPEALPFGEAELKPLRGGETLAWRLAADRPREHPHDRHDARIALPDRRRQLAGEQDRRLLAELSTLGATNIRRAYGNWKKDDLKGWEELLHEYAIRPIQQFDYSQGQERDRHGHGHRRDGPALHRPARGLRHRLLRQRLHAAGAAPEGQGRAVFGFGAKTRRCLSSTPARASSISSIASAHEVAAARRRGDGGTGAPAPRRSPAAPPPRVADAPLRHATARRASAPAARTRSRLRPAKTAGRRSAASASRSATRPRSTRAITATQAHRSDQGDRAVRARPKRLPDFALRDRRQAAPRPTLRERRRTERRLRSPRHARNGARTKAATEPLRFRSLGLRGRLPSARSAAWRFAGRGSCGP